MLLELFFAAEVLFSFEEFSAAEAVCNTYPVSDCLDTSFESVMASNDTVASTSEHDPSMAESYGYIDFCVSVVHNSVSSEWWVSVV